MRCSFLATCRLPVHEITNAAETSSKTILLPLASAENQIELDSELKIELKHESEQVSSGELNKANQIPKNVPKMDLTIRIWQACGLKGLVRKLFETGCWNGEIGSENSRNSQNYQNSRNHQKPQNADSIDFTPPKVYCVIRMPFLSSDASRRTKSCQISSFNPQWDYQMDISLPVVFEENEVVMSLAEMFDSAMVLIELHDETSFSYLGSVSIPLKRLLMKSTGIRSEWFEIGEGRNSISTGSSLQVDVTLNKNTDRDLILDFADRYGWNLPPIPGIEFYDFSSNLHDFSLLVTVGSICVNNSVLNGLNLPGNDRIRVFARFKVYNNEHFTTPCFQLYKMKNDQNHGNNGNHGNHGNSEKKTDFLFSKFNLKQTFKEQASLPLQYYLWESTLSVQLYACREDQTKHQLFGEVQLPWIGCFYNDNAVLSYPIVSPNQDDLSGMWMRAGLFLKQDSNVNSGMQGNSDSFKCPLENMDLVEYNEGDFKFDTRDLGQKNSIKLMIERANNLPEFLNSSNFEKNDENDESSPESSAWAVSYFDSGVQQVTKIAISQITDSQKHQNLRISNPKFNFSTIINNETTSLTLRVLRVPAEIFDNDNVSPELILDAGIPVGVASIDLGPLKARDFAVIDGWYELFDLKGISQGQIKIVAKWANGDFESNDPGKMNYAVDFGNGNELYYPKIPGKTAGKRENREIFENSSFIGVQTGALLDKMGGNYQNANFSGNSPQNQTQKTQNYTQNYTQNNTQNSENTQNTPNTQNPNSSFMNDVLSTQLAELERLTTQMKTKTDIVNKKWDEIMSPMSPQRNSKVQDIQINDDDDDSSLPPEEEDDDFEMVEILEPKQLSSSVTYFDEIEERETLKGIFERNGDVSARGFDDDVSEKVDEIKIVAENVEENVEETDLNQTRNTSIWDENEKSEALNLERLKIAETFQNSKNIENLFDNSEENGFDVDLISEVDDDFGSQDSDIEFEVNEDENGDENDAENDARNDAKTHAQNELEIATREDFNEELENSTENHLVTASISFHSPENTDGGELSEPTIQLSDVEDFPEENLPEDDFQSQNENLKSTVATFQNTGTQQFPIEANTTVSLENSQNVDNSQNFNSQNFNSQNFNSQNLTKTQNTEKLLENPEKKQQSEITTLRSRASTQPENSTPRDENSSPTDSNKNNNINRNLNQHNFAGGDCSSHPVYASGGELHSDNDNQIPSSVPKNSSTEHSSRNTSLNLSREQRQRADLLAKNQSEQTRRLRRILAATFDGDDEEGEDD